MALPVVVAVVTTGIALVFGVFYAYRKFYCHNFFRRIGIAGPEPHWFYGNAHEFNADRHLVLQKWRQQYGDFYGFYEGSSPILVVSSLEAAEQICVKQFWNFQGHYIGPVQPDPLTDSKNSIFAADLLFAWGSHWKRLRNNTNHCFSTGKLKSYLPLISRTQSNLMNALEERVQQSGGSFDILDLYHSLALDVVSTVAFGTEINSFSKEHGNGNAALPVLREAIDLFLIRPKLLDIIPYFSEIIGPVKRIIKLQANLFGGGLMRPWVNLYAMSKQVVERRAKESAMARQDIIQSLIERSTLASKKTVEGNDDDLLSADEVVASTMIFFAAGTETSGTALGFVSYLLAVNPDVQERLYREIAKICPTSIGVDQLDYDTVMTLPYLDWVVKETLRIYPIGALVVNRFVMNDTEVCGVPVSKGLRSVYVNVYAIHNDPQLWCPVDPSKFYPERFSPEYSSNRPEAAYMAFGYGPRLCVGMRLALVEVKFTMVKILMRYKIVPPTNGYPAEGLPIRADLLITSKEGVPIGLIPRR